MENNRFENIKVAEMRKLAEKLEDMRIPYAIDFPWKNCAEMYGDYAVQIIVFDDNHKRIADAVCHEHSYGGRWGELEVMANVYPDSYDYARNDGVAGCLKAEDAFYLLVYAYIHDNYIHDRQ